jgi:hypothetical protein
MMTFRTVACCADCGTKLSPGDFCSECGEAKDISDTEDELHDALSCDCSDCENVRAAAATHPRECGCWMCDFADVRRPVFYGACVWPGGCCEQRRATKATPLCRHCEDVERYVGKSAPRSGQ